MSTLKQLCQRFGLQPKPGATPEDIAAFETETRLKLPPAVREFYSASDGLEVEACGFRFQSLTQARSLTLQFNSDETTHRHLGYFVFTESWDSNPCCVCCNGPLTGHVVRIRHDGTPRLLARSLDSFLDRLQRLLARSQPRVVPESAEEEDTEEEEEDLSCHLDDLVGDFTGLERTPVDVAAGEALRQILQTVGGGEPAYGELRAFIKVLLPK